MGIKQTFVRYVFCAIWFTIFISAESPPNLKSATSKQNKGCITGQTPETLELLKSRQATVGAPCIFPFNVRNKTYHSCTYDFSHITGYNPWCSTNVDSEGYHIADNEDGSKTWGLCLDEVNCPIPPRRCGTVKADFQETSRFSDLSSKPVDIRRQPWLASIVGTVGPNTLEHECTASIITSRHVLTSATCAKPIMDDEDGFLRYAIRMGSTDLNSGSLERKIRSIHIHPEYKNNPSEFDVGIIEFNEEIVFTDYVQQVCLPYLPIDEDEYEEDNLVTIAGYYNVETCDNSETFASMQISSDQIDSMKNGKERISRELNLDSTINSHTACTKENLGDDPASFDGGSPVVKLISGTARIDPYYEQHFILSFVSKEEKKVKILTRISDRTILLWIQDITDTSPLVMVVGGYSIYRELKDPKTNMCQEDKNGKCKRKPGLINDVEIVKLMTEEDDENVCTKFTSPVFGNAYVMGKDKDGLIIENEGEVLGHVGVFSKDAAIVCGGKNGDGDQKYCYEWDTDVNRWKSKHKHPEDGNPPMKSKRDRASSVTNHRGNMWVLGGRRDEEEGLTTTEVYEYQPKGKGRWKKGPNLPKDLPGGLESHCTVRIDNGRTMLIGGFMPVFGDDGGYQNQRTWIYHGIGIDSQWKETAETHIGRDRPACSLVNMPDGKVRVLVAGGCDGWCAENAPLSSAELYDPETNTWKMVADMPEPLSSAKLELLENKPTTFGGWNGRVQVGTLYQYYVKENVWRAHRHTQLRMPRSSAAVFQVPRDFFRC